MNSGNGFGLCFPVKLGIEAVRPQTTGNSSTRSCELPGLERHGETCRSILATGTPTFGDSDVGRLMESSTCCLSDYRATATLSMP